MISRISALELIKAMTEVGFGALFLVKIAMKRSSKMKNALYKYFNNPICRFNLHFFVYYFVSFANLSKGTYNCVCDQLKPSYFELASQAQLYTLRKVDHFMAVVLFVFIFILPL